MIVAREARTIAERNRPSTQAAGTRARGGWEPAFKRDARTSHMQPLCFKQHPRPSPGGRQEDRGVSAHSSHQTVSFQRQTMSRKPAAPQTPHRTCWGPRRLSAAGTTHLPLRRRLTSYILNINRVKALQVGWELWQHHLIGSWHPQKAPLSCLGPTRGPETPRQRFCLR